MTPQEIYRRMVATIREADVRLVAARMENHIGQETFYFEVGNGK